MTSAHAPNVNVNVNGTEPRRAERVSLGKTGVHVSRIGIGAIAWGTDFYGGTEDDVATMAAEARARGVDFIDTAEAYGDGASETRVEEITRGTEFVVTTKFKSFPPRSANDLARALDASLSRLKRSTVDLYLIHFPMPWHSIPRLMGHLADAVESGKVRAVGVSNYSADQMRRAHEALARRGSGTPAVRTPRMCGRLSPLSAATSRVERFGSVVSKCSALRLAARSRTGFC
jgi:aryl-alcohol dehydrogenase-like predicted oxidoreductase